VSNYDLHRCEQAEAYRADYRNAERYSRRVILALGILFLALAAGITVAALSIP